jgi:N-acetylmuramoyl-L-alanine amidase
MVTRSTFGTTLGLKIEHIGEDRHNRPGTPMTPRYITIHNTDNSSIGADAEAHSRFVRNTGYYVHNGHKRWISWHYTVDDDSCVRHLPLNEVAWHAGTTEGNANSIGIEICMNADLDQDRAFDRAQRLIACLCYDLRLDVDAAVVPHMHWSGKKCPSLLLDAGEIGRKWNSFANGIKEYVNLIDDVDGV